MKIMGAAKKALHSGVRDSNKRRMQNLFDKMYGTWKSTGAKEFYQTLRNNPDTRPRRSFLDPSTGMMTSDPATIEGLFHKDWSAIYNYQVGESKPDYAQFKCEFGAHYGKIGIIDDSDIKSQELHLQSKKRKGNAEGEDSWRREELRHLPPSCWDRRADVENLILRTGRPPQAYHTVPQRMLRKGKGATPLEHRGISLFCTTYRNLTSVIWTRIIQAFMEWVHPDTRGALPDREGMEVPFDTQADIEKAILLGHDLALITTDYSKFFDLFHHDFHRQLMVDIGIPPVYANLAYTMAHDMKRAILIGQHTGPAHSYERGAGQGDVLVLLQALCLMSVQFKVISAKHPLVKLGGVLDDRSLRDPPSKSWQRHVQQSTSTPMPA